MADPTSYGNASYTNNNGASYSYGATGGNNGGGAYNNSSTATAAADPGGLRRRSAVPPNYGNYNNNYQATTHDDDKLSGKRSYRPGRDVVEKLDFLFPKVDREFTVQTKGGGVASLVATGLIVLLILAETITWYSQNRMDVTRTYVDNSLGKKMQVHINVTFPSMACDDLHVDVIDVAGDSQIDVDDTLVKRKLHKNGDPMTQEELQVETNLHRQQQLEKERILKSELPEDYCGTCYGAEEEEGQCCQTCDEVIEAYTKKRWKTNLLKFTSEQCVREGRDKSEAPKRLVFNQGCNLAGYMTLNRVAGNFHIAMGEGVERDGRHIHTYMPEDAPNFNVSHIIHTLRFGPAVDNAIEEPLNGIRKIVTETTGTTGLFQYFIKIVPTSYVGTTDAISSVEQQEMAAQQKGQLKTTTIETNRYHVTERFMPLMTDLLEDHQKEEGDDPRHAVHAGHAAGNHAHQDHHKIQNSVLPGVFFIYEIYPFAVEISKNSVPFTHLLIRIMATIGGVFTLAKWADSIIYDRSGNKKNSNNRSSSRR
eukprot:scaffold174_cov98-Cylindrotheca_fusiformis.AAC.8